MKGNIGNFIINVKIKRLKKIESGLKARTITEISKERISDGYL